MVRGYRRAPPADKHNLRSHTADEANFLRAERSIAKLQSQVNPLHPEIAPHEERRRLRGPDQRARSVGIQDGVLT